MSGVKNFMASYNIPQGTPMINYLGGCFGNRNCYVFFKVSPTGIYLCEYNTKIKPFFKYIPKENLIAFSQIGDHYTNSIVSGGGVSLGGAAVGAAFFGPVGAIVGSHKKVKTKTINVDTRKTILKFRENGIENSLILSSSAYDILCCNFIEKKI